MADTPNSYRDPYWSDLARGAEDQLGLPKGLLVAALTRGERSNADQVSEAGARTPFQVTPKTRQLVLDRDGIDAYLSPENAAEVAGLVLKDGMNWAKSRAQSPEEAAKLAVGYYHAGGDLANWGPKTKAYVQRVTGSPLGAMPDGSQSTFDRLSSQMQFPTRTADAPTIAGAFNAYQAGKMSAKDAAEFEGDVTAGRIMLPQGAQLKTAAPAGATPALPAGVLAAYSDGRMTAADKKQLEADVRAGLVSLPAGIQLADGVARAAIPGAPQTPPAPTAEPGILDQAIGAGEAALSAGTGIVGGTLGMIGGTLGGLAGSVASGTLGTPAGADAVEQAASQGAQALTYAPRTQSGQTQTAAVGAGMQALLPVMPLTAEMGALAQFAGPAAEQYVRLVRPAESKVMDAARGAVPGSVAAVANKIASAVRPGERAPTPGTLGSAGAAGTDMANMRRAAAADLPQPIELTRGQAERSFEQQRFEQEAAKDPSAGAPLRDRFADQNAAIPQNFEAFIDATGAKATSLTETGRAIVDDGLVQQAARKKTEYRVKYREAEKAGQMEEPVSTAPIVDFLKANASFNAPELAGGVLGLAERELVRLGGADMVDGALVARDLPLKQVELLRRQVGNAIDASPQNATNMRAGAQLKELIDTSTEGLGGGLYKEARAARRRYAELFEDNAIVSDLLKTRKGTADRQVALENVFRRTVLNGTRDDLRMLRRTLQVDKSPEGMQAWREVQGATLRHIIDEATKGVATDIRGNPIVSPAKLNAVVRALDQGGKLDFLLSKRGAQQIRDINDIAKVVLTAPPGTINTSNTASVVLAALAEAGALGAVTGVPLPVMSGLRMIAAKMKDRKMQARVQDALKSKP